MIATRIDAPKLTAIFTYSMYDGRCCREMIADSVHDWCWKVTDICCCGMVLLLIYSWFFAAAVGRWVCRWLKVAWNKYSNIIFRYYTPIIFSNKQTKYYYQNKWWDLLFCVWWSKLVFLIIGRQWRWKPEIIWKWELKSSSQIMYEMLVSQVKL